MATLRFALFDEPGIICKLIKFWTRGNICHTAFVLDYDKHLLIEPYGPNLRWSFTRLEDHPVGSKVEIWAKEVRTYQLIETSEFLVRIVKHNFTYDWKGILSFVFKTSDAKDKYFCSEGCTIALIEGHVWPRLNAAIIHPTFFRELLRVSGFTLEKRFTL